MPTCRKCQNTGLIQKTVKTGQFIEAQVKRWCKLEPFSPSSHQILRYLGFKGYPIPRHKKEDRNTSDQEALQKIAHKTKDPLIPLILKYRAVEKINSTQVEGWAPATDGCVHSEFLYYPATGQLCSRSPNVQNSAAGKGEEGLKKKLAKRFRNLVEARPFHTLIKMDYRSFHAVTLALEAQDPVYMRMAKQDIHTFFAATSLLKLETPQKLMELTPQEYESYVKWFKGDPGRKTTRDRKAKPTILGVGFGLQAKHLHEYNPDSISSREEAQRLLDALKGLFPNVFQWQQSIKCLAHKQHFLRSRWGYVRWFWDVLWKGEQAEQAIAFLPANDAFGMMRSLMVELEEAGLNEKYGLCLNEHDALMFHCPEKEAEECVHVVKGMMERPCLTLRDPKVAPLGLSVEVEVERGKTWSTLKEIKTCSLN